MKEELEMIRRNVTPAQFCAGVRYQLRQHKFEGIHAEDIDLYYWKRGDDLNFDNTYTDPKCGCVREVSRSKPYDMQTYVENSDGSVYNLILEFTFDTERTGTGYFYYHND